MVTKKQEVVKLDPEQLRALVDEIGYLKARIAPEEEKLKEKSDLLKSQGVGVFTGLVFDAVVSEVERASLDQDMIKQKLREKLGNYFASFIERATKITKYKKLDVNARVLQRQ
jgi:hypothetical protein